jgi:hypothetical protein
MTQEAREYGERHLAYHMRESGYYTEEEAQEIEAMMKEIQIESMIKVLWFLASTAAYMQEMIFPNWLRPECPRFLVEEGTTEWVIATVEPEDLRAPAHAPMEPYIHVTETPVHLDVHRFSLSIDNAIIDGLYDIGVGFLYLGPPDPDRYNQEERRGFGNMYCWIRKLDTPDGGRVHLLST